jgi:hypothetical protein
MPRLRRPGSLGSIERENIALHHHDMFEEVGKDAGRRQAGHSRTNNDSLAAYQRHFPSPKLTFQKMGASPMDHGEPDRSVIGTPVCRSGGNPDGFPDRRTWTQKRGSQGVLGEAVDPRGP